MVEDKLASFGGQMQPLTASAIATLAFTKIFEKTLEKFTEAALTKMDQLRKKIWDKLRGNSEAETALAAVEQGNRSELERVAICLEDAMDKDRQFADEVRALAKEIDAGKLQDNSTMTQNNYGGRNSQISADGSTNSIDMGDKYIQNY